jgi:hypothetical protein
MPRAFLLLLFALGLATPAWSQTVTDERVWTTFTAQGRLGAGSPWRWSSDTLVRTRDGARTKDFLAGRVLITRELTRGSSAGFGYAYGAGFPGDGGTVGEHRFMQQYVWSGFTADRRLSFRTRLEERVIEGNNSVVVRVRQQVRVNWPIAASRRLQLVAFEEVFVNASSTARVARGFDSNRVFAGVRQAVTPRSSVEVGYLNVYTRLRPGITRRSHILSAILAVTF